MNQQVSAWARLWSPAAAFESPATKLVVGVLAGILIMSGLAIIVMRATRRASPELGSELTRRYLAWLVMAPIAVVPILLGALPTIVFACIIALMGYREFARATGLFRHGITSATVVAATLALFFAVADNWYGFFAALMPIGVGLIIATAIVPDHPQGYLQRVALGVLAFMLFGGGMAHLAYFANDSMYRPILLWIICCAQMNDVFAFCAGKTIGGPKLSPQTSPNKTISGSVGAIILTTTMGVALGHIVFRGTVLDVWPHLLMMGVLLSVLGQLGDLTLSSIKRDLGIKDMGALIPGHGGVLDRINSLLLVGPGLFHYIYHTMGLGEHEAARLITSWSP